MKFPLIALSGLLLVNSASAVNYLLNFEGGTADAPIHGSDGWSVGGTTEDPAFPLAYVRPYDAGSGLNLGGAFGGVYGAPELGETPTVGRSFTNTFAGPKVLSFQSTVLDSTTGDGLTTRDTFGFVVRDGGGDALLTVELRPSSQSADPDNDTASYTVYYAFGGGALVSSSNNISEGGFYNFSLTTDASGLQFAFGTQSQNFTFDGALGAYDVNDTTLSLEFTWAQGGADFGDNELLFDNISIVPVPEPSAALLGLGALGFLAARRRR